MFATQRTVVENETQLRTRSILAVTCLQLWITLSAIWPSKLSFEMDFSEKMSIVFETSAITELMQS